MSGKRGFASLSPELRREYSRAGGLAVHEYGTAHAFTSETARIAGAKGRDSQQQAKKQDTSGRGDK